MPKGGDDVTTRIVLFLLVSASALVGLTGVAGAQPYPNRPIAMIVSFGPGGPSDFVARLVSAGIEKDVRQPVAVENVPGGNGAVGAAKFERAVGDGYTLL